MFTVIFSNTPQKFDGVFHNHENAKDYADFHKSISHCVYNIDISYDIIDLENKLNTRFSKKDLDDIFKEMDWA